MQKWHTLSFKESEWKLLQVLLLFPKISNRALTILYLLEKNFPGCITKLELDEHSPFSSTILKEKIITYRKLKKLLKTFPIEHHRIVYKALQRFFTESKKGKKKEKPIVSKNVQKFINKLKAWRWITSTTTYIELDYYQMLAHITFVIWFESFYEKNEKELKRDLEKWELTEEKIIEKLKKEWEELWKDIVFQEGLLIKEIKETKKEDESKKVDPYFLFISRVQKSCYRECFYLFSDILENALNFRSFDEWKKEIEILLIISNFSREVKNFEKRYPWLSRIIRDLQIIRGVFT